MFGCQGDDAPPRGYGGTNQEIAVLKDLIEHQATLFKVGTIDREKERKMQEAMRKINDALASPHASVSIALASPHASVSIAPARLAAARLGQYRSRRTAARLGQYRSRFAARLDAIFGQYCAHLAHVKAAATDDRVFTATSATFVN